MSFEDGAAVNATVTTLVDVLVTSAITVSYDEASYNSTNTSLDPKLCVTVYEVADPSPIEALKESAAVDIL